MQEGGHHGVALAVIGVLQSPDEDPDVLRQQRQDHVQTFRVGRHLHQDGQRAQEALG